MVRDTIRELGYLCLGSRLKRIGERLQADVQRLADNNDIDIQSSHFPLLAAIHQQGPLTVGELVSALGTKQPGVTRSVGQLVDRGYVDIARHDVDQRRKTVSLTASGKKLVRRSQKEIWPCIETSLKELCGNQTGELLDLLDFLEDELTESSLERRVSAELNRLKSKRHVRTPRA